MNKLQAQREAGWNTKYLRESAGFLKTTFCTKHMTPRKEEERTKRQEMCLLNTFTFLIQFLSPAQSRWQYPDFTDVVIELKEV